MQTLHLVNELFCIVVPRIEWRGGGWEKQDSKDLSKIFDIWENTIQGHSYWYKYVGKLLILNRYYKNMLVQKFMKYFLWPPNHMPEMSLGGPPLAQLLRAGLASNLAGY